MIFRALNQRVTQLFNFLPECAEKGIDFLADGLVNILLNGCLQLPKYARVSDITSSLTLLILITLRLTSSS